MSVLGGGGFINKVPASEEPDNSQQPHGQIGEDSQVPWDGVSVHGLELHFSGHRVIHQFAPSGFASAALDLPVGVQAEVVIASGRLPRMILWAFAPAVLFAWNAPVTSLLTSQIGSSLSIIGILVCRPPYSSPHTFWSQTLFLHSVDCLLRLKRCIKFLLGQFSFQCA